MATRILINGFGRIGRLICRLALDYDDIEVVAVNDRESVENLAYLLRYDTPHGSPPFSISLSNHSLAIQTSKKLHTIRFFNMSDIELLSHKELDIDVVIEATGVFTTKEACARHLVAGAKRVILTSPVKGEAIPTFVMGVNHQTFNPREDFIYSNASCTTNCLALIARVLVDYFGIELGFMTTVHAVTATQFVVDKPSKRDFRAGRAAFSNIIPSTTGAIEAVGNCLPELKGKLSGMALRVPVLDGSLLDLTVKLARQAPYWEVCKAMKEASEGYLKGFLGYTADPVVSSDFIGCELSAIFDEKAGLALDGGFYKLLAWYDNEMSYAARVIDLLRYTVKKALKSE